MRTFIMIVLSLLCVSLESTVLHSIEMRGIIPNLSLILIVGYSVLQGSRRGRILGLILGLIHELLFFQSIGFYALMFYYFGQLAGMVKKNYNRENLILPLVLIIGADLIFCLSNYFVQILMHGKFEFIYYLTSKILPEVCYTGLVALPVFALLSMFDRLIVHLEVFLENRKKARVR